MVLGHLKTANLQLSLTTRKFSILEVDFLGHRLDAAGIHMTRDKVHAIAEAPSLTSKQRLQAFLGFLSFYDRFLEQEATTARGLYLFLGRMSPGVGKRSTSKRLGT